MNNKIKIINILHHRPKYIEGIKDVKDYDANPDTFEYISINKPPYWIGFFKRDHHVIHAQKILQRSHDFELECWRPYGTEIDQIYTKKVDGILHKVFPSKHKYIPIASRFYWSETLLSELKKEIKENKVIIHFHDGHSRFVSWLILNLKKSKFPIVYQHRSQYFAIYRYLARKNPLKKLNVFILLYDYPRQIKTLKYIDCYVWGSPAEKKFLSSRIPDNKMLYATDGVDFNMFKPCDKENIIELKKQLNISPNKKIILYVGRMRKRNYSYIIPNAFKKIKQSHKDVELLIVGINKSEECYKTAIDSGAIIVPKIEHKEIVKYFQIADVFIHPQLNPIIAKHCGLGTSVIEAMAIGIPIISNSLYNLPGLPEEMEKVGLLFHSEEELACNIKYVLNNPNKYKKNEIRNIAKKYFDVNKSIESIIDMYKKLGEKYYNK